MLNAIWAKIKGAIVLPNLEKLSQERLWYESNLFWGAIAAISASGTIVLTVVATMKHDIRWMLFGAWICSVVALWAILKLLKWRQWLCVPLAIVLAFSLWELSVWLNPNSTTAHVSTGTTGATPPAEKQKEVTPTPPSTASKKRQTQPKDEARQNQSNDRPYFSLIKIEITKTNPDLIAQVKTDYMIQITLVNIGKHKADSFRSRGITIDQAFQKKPRISDTSIANDFPPESPFACYTGITLSPVLLPSYEIFAIKYEDKETSPRRTFSQVWYFKHPGGKAEAPFSQYFEASIPEREDILNYLKNELKDYAE